MNINQLLSPDDATSSPRDSGSSSNPTADSTSHYHARPGSLGQPTSFGRRHQGKYSPERPPSQNSTPKPWSDLPSTPQHNGLSSNSALPPISEGSAPSIPSEHTSNRTELFAHTQRRPSRDRAISTPQMKTLADLASMQQRHRPARAHSASVVGRVDTGDAQLSPSTKLSAPPVSRTLSSQSLADVTMAEAPSQTQDPKVITATAAALSEDEAKKVTDLLKFLSQNSYAYDSHVQLIHLLRKGFRSHAGSHDQNSGHVFQHATTSAMFIELRQAREAMDSRFAVGEQLWSDWLADEVLWAQSSEERISLTELFQRAVADEPSSVTLWVAYADWVERCYAACANLDGADYTGWSEEDRETCKELFTKDMLLNILEQGSTATRWRIDQSHVLWNRLAAAVQHETEIAPSPGHIQRLHAMYTERVQIPHMASEQTIQMFWPIVNKYNQTNWEASMARVNELAEPAKRQIAARRDYELPLQRSVEAADLATAYQEFTRYLKWESKSRRHNSEFEQELRIALYERMLLLFPAVTEWWLEYVDYVITCNPSTSVMPLLERATRHCPWSGELWALRILRADVEGSSREDIESIKHRATNAGLLDVGGLEELLKMLQQWCSYLRRHAYRNGSTEDDVDTAEVGITMAIEDIQQAGEKYYGKDYKGDPLYRLETIQTKFYTESRRLNDAREIYKQLSLAQGRDSFDFWLRYYYFEFCLWGIERMTEPKRVETRENGPHLATAVVQQALLQKNLDAPEKALDLYMYHFQQHESGERLQSALVEGRQFAKRLGLRRAKEAEAAQHTAAQHSTVDVETEVDHNSVSTGAKRKAGAISQEEESSKKVKVNGASEALATQDVLPSASESIQTKRDREHNTITLRNLPPNVEQKDIEKFFRDISRPKSVEIIKDIADNVATAKVEFESREDVLSAKTRSGKELNGFTVKIESGNQSTLYVTNYPAEYDEHKIRSLFESYGEITNVRLPSLTYNKRRRFCYVSFLTAEMAKTAEGAMDGKKLDGLHTLVAKISNPEAAKKRSGAQAEGREIFVRNIDSRASEAEVKLFFEQFGNVISMNLLKRVDGRRTGSGFVVYSSSQEATAALSADLKPLKDRILHVELATPKGGAASVDKARKDDVIVKGATSASPEPGFNARRGSDVSMGSAGHGHDLDSARTAKERKIAIFNLPDTVNDARIKATMESYGPIVKIQLRRQDHGAVVEFVNLKDAFNVRQGVDCTSLGPNVKTGDVGELLGKGKKGQSTGTAGFSMMLAPAMVSRPAQPGGGRRGGLGKKAGLGYTARPNKDEKEAAPKAGGAKSNADFRAMLEQSRVEAEKDDAGT